jgi:hypothetical protein
MPNRQLEITNVAGPELGARREGQGFGIRPPSSMGVKRAESGSKRTPNSAPRCTEA